jgi:uncharacterized membrane protein
MKKVSRNMGGESRKRTLAKTVSYRILIILSDIVVLFLLTKSYDLTLAFVIASNAVTAVEYYFHERLWSGIAWGRQ